MKEIPNGVWVTMLTPFTSDNKIDYNALEQMITWYAQNKVDGLFAVCLSSEMYHLTLEERVELSRFVVEKNNGRMAVVSSGHISDTIEEQIEELRLIAQTKPDAVVMVVNRLAKENEGEDILLQNAKRIMDALPDVTFGLYECPHPYHRILSPEAVRWFAQTGRVVFMKDTSCDETIVEQKVKAVQGTPLKIFPADSAKFYESLKVGACGYCGIMANFHPQVYHWLTQNWKENKELAEKLWHFSVFACFVGYRTYPVCAKYYLQQEGLDLELYTRKSDYKELTDLGKIAVDHLRGLWYDLKKEADL